MVANALQAFSPQAALALYLSKNYDQLCQLFYSVIKHFHEVCYTSFSREDMARINSFVETFLYILGREDFKFPDNWGGLFINVNHLISNLITISGHKSADGYIRAILTQQNNYVKLLVLYTCRSQVEIPAETLIAPNPTLATLWWNNFSVAPPGATSEALDTKMVQHLNGFPDNLYLPDYRVQPTYFQSSYHGIDERPIKEWYNKQVRRFTSQVKIKCNPKKGRIAIITDKWSPVTAVYKSLYPQVVELAKHYDLTLIHTQKAAVSELDTSIFKRVKQIHIALDKIDLSSIATSDFELAYFPDVGMTDDSVCLANMRLAPIMVCGYGHPVSTYGSLIDYFIGGSESELLSHYQENYSERLVLIPGLGAHPVDPKYTRKYPERTETAYINCCWTTAKINWPMLRMLRDVQFQSPRPVHYQFFPSWTSTRYNNASIIGQELGELFGGNVSVYPNLSYQDYLEKMERGSFTVDSYPFGGYNTIVDSFFVGCPVVTIEGTKFYNRASSALARRVGLDLSCCSVHACKKRMLELLANPQYLDVCRTVLGSSDCLYRKLINTDEPTYFVKAIKHLIANHPIAGKEPIIIQ